MPRPIQIALLLVSLLPNGARAQDRPHADAKSAAPAIGLAAANTVIPVALVLSNWNDSNKYFLLYPWVIGPFPGLAFAGDADRGMEGVGARLITLGVAGAIAIAVEISERNEGSDDGPDWLLLIPGGVTVASWIADIAAIRSTVRGENESLTISPMVGSKEQVGAHIQVRW